jgi:hypothetical protein
MTERSSGLPAFVLKDMDVLVLVFLFDAFYSLSIRGQDILEVRKREVRKLPEMDGVFDDHLVNADSVHPLEDAFIMSFRREPPIQGGELVGNGPHPPAGLVRPAAALS